MMAPDPFERRHSPVALLLSLGAHLGLLAALLSGVLTPTMDGRIASLSGLVMSPRGGGGGGAGVTMRYVALGPAVSVADVPMTIRPPPAPPPVEPAEELPPPVPDTDPVASVVPGTATVGTISGGEILGGVGPGTGGGTGGGAGTGRGTGTGGGEGAGSGGEGGRAVPPEPRQMIIPPEFPASMRGLRIAVTFAVSVDGRVRQVEFEPAVPDRGYARRLEAVMRDYRFRPARDPQGRDVAGVARVVLTF